MLAAAVALPAVLVAQTTVSSDAMMRANPEGKALGTVRAGAPVVVLNTRHCATEVTIEGFVHRSLVGGKRDGFSASVKEDGALLRAAAKRDARVLARWSEGIGLTKLSAAGDWVRVRRSGWVATTAVHRGKDGAKQEVAERKSGPRVAAATAAPNHEVAASSHDATSPVVSSAGAVADTAAHPPAAAPDFLTAHRVMLATAPDHRSGSVVDSGTYVRALARDRGWVRVQLEGWVRESDLTPADTAIRSSLSAADLRASPDAARGKIVRWSVQSIALQHADPLRRDMAPEEPYLLARGPGTENALLYLALPPSLVERARMLRPLQTVTVTARVRNGRSEPSGVPILDVQTLADQR